MKKTFVIVVEVEGNEEIKYYRDLVRENEANRPEIVEEVRKAINGARFGALKITDVR